jgi:5,6-dimethylbenzimidazole synthase
MALAPSVGNCRPWRVILVMVPALRGALRDRLLASNMAAAASYEGTTRDDYLRFKLAGLDEANALLNWPVR